MELADALQRSTDGQIKMSPNLDGNIAENVIAKTTELSGFIQGKNIKVEVRDVFTENSVDVRAINLDTGKYQNYQLKFGKDAKATIDLIERGNYNNQQIIVPSEQLEEVRAHFKAKGSSKTITDHIDAWGAEGKKFTKENMKELQLAAQEDGIMKVGAGVAVARRGGLSATYDELNKYFGISNMPIATSQYWNSIHDMTLFGSSNTWVAKDTGLGDGAPVFV